MINFLDLHMHSTKSDGVKSPRELIGIAKEKGIELISLTDHDTVDGILEAGQEAEKEGISFIPGIELSCFDQRDTHVLGYGINFLDEDFLNTLKCLQELRQSRMVKMVETLAADGFEINVEEVKEKCGGSVFGRPHVAAVLVEKGYGENTRDIFNKYIASGRPYYIGYKKLDVKEGIELIHKAGGYAVLAHPRLLRYKAKELAAKLKQYKGFGLDGLEVYYPCHKIEDISLYQALAKELNLFVTCGGDFHNPKDPTKNTMGFKAKELPGIEDSLKLLLKEAQ